jgi:hypothetical protein
VRFTSAFSQSGNNYWRGRLSKFDLLVLTSLDYLTFILKIYLPFFTKQVNISEPSSEISAYTLVYTIVSKFLNLPSNINLFFCAFSIKVSTSCIELCTKSKRIYWFLQLVCLIFIFCPFSNSVFLSYPFVFPYFLPFCHPPVLCLFQATALLYTFQFK